MTIPIRLLVIIAVAFAIGSGAAFYLLRPSSGPPLMSAKALIGGPFALTDHTGKRVTEQDFRGKFMLVTFGYTFCPDVCPAELQAVAAAMDGLGANGDKVNPVFVTIDPERDTVQQMAGYVGNFHPRLVGLTGSPEEIKKTARAWRVFYAKAEGDTPPGSYLMDHSAFIYLMDPKGEYVTHFPYGTEPAKMTAGIAKAMASAGSG